MEIGEILSVLKANWTPGGIGIWVIVIMLAGTLWKGLPAVLTAWDARLAKRDERIDAELARYGKLLKESDERHEECRRENAAIRQELTDVYGQLRQLRQMIMSGGIPAHDDLPPTMTALLSGLNTVPGTHS